jgi:LacI family repressor for deo operon, udp, cdd, tsx, nupC, and nupG
MDEIRKTPTIQDVARRAKVSAATVSRALSSPERVSEATRARVAIAVQDTGYTINQAARSLRLRAARTILIALPNIGNPFYSTILEAVVGEAARRGYGVLVANKANGPNWINEHFLSNRVDGLLLFDGGIDTRELDALPDRGGRPPLVVAYDELPDRRVNSVLTDNRAAAERAVEHLVGLGHRAIGHIIGQSRNADPNERHLGFRQAMKRAKLALRTDWRWQGDYSMPSGMAAGEAYLRLKERPTAVFAGNDEMAIGFISALRAAGVECPRDVSVIGFDDISVAANYAPPLTTMRQPRDEIGRRATEILIDILDGATAPHGPTHVVLRAELVVRGSTAPALPPAPAGARA